MTIAARHTAHVLIGSGAHAKVFRRPGSRWVVQTFHPDTPLTAHRLTWEYDYLRAVYASMTDLIPPQRLFQNRPDAPLAEALLVKQYVDVDPTRALLSTQAEQLTASERLQLTLFVTITRTQLAFPLAGDVPDSGVPRLPDIIDDDFRNLAFDRLGRLRLLDTNELISTAHLYELIGTATTLDLEHRRIHAKFFTRLLMLETIIGRSHHELVADPLYRGYLAAGQIDAMLCSTTICAGAEPALGERG